MGRLKLNDIDYTGGATEASDVSYDNTTSGLSADDVQDAVDELTSDITGTSASEALYHLGFYLDSNGGLCQVNSI